MWLQRERVYDRDLEEIDGVEYKLNRHDDAEVLVVVVVDDVFEIRK